MSRHPARLLFYSHGGIGLGHFRRQLRLAEAFRARHPGAALLLITGSHAAGEFAGPLGFDYVSLPTIRMLDRYETWEPRQLELPIRDVMRIRRDLLLRTVRRFRPDVLVADFMPAGPYGELLDALRELRDQGGRAVAGFRDIIDDPPFVRRLWTKLGIYDVLTEYYDAICVYGAPEVTCFRSAYGLEGDLAGRLHYVGYLCCPPQDSAPSVEADPVLLACSGGGADGGALLRTFVDATRMLSPRLGGRRLVVGGPLLSREEMEHLREQAGSARIEVTRFVLELDRRIASSDLVVTMPGYNTTCEILSSRVRAVVVPRSGPSLEQRLRASQLERWRRATSLEPLELNAESLATAIETALAGPRPLSPAIPLDGLRRSVALLAALAAGEPASVPA